MTRMDKNAVYDGLCKALTDFEMSKGESWSVDELYKTLVKIQNDWEELTATDEN